MRRTLLTLGVSAVSLFIFAGRGGAAVLDIPGNRATLSGIGVISGWKCEATGALTIRFDGGGAHSAFAWSGAGRYPA